MCGIAGIVGKEASAGNVARVNGMLPLLRHRGPDDQGVWQQGKVCLGHCRLSIIDLSQAAHQPMVSEDGFVLVFNGEIYNYKSLRSELESKGVRFVSQSDTEVLLHSYRLWREQCLSKIDGFFAFAIWDEKNKKLFCARDPFGKKPFYYTQENGEFIFASEVEAVVAARDSRPEPNTEDMSHYLWLGYFPAGKSAYNGILTLKAGWCLELSADDGLIKSFPYCQPVFDMAASKEEVNDSLLIECDDMLAASVRKRLQSDVPVGVLLSGGVDSSLVSIYAGEQSKEKIHTYTATFSKSAYDESPYAAQVVSHIQSLHTNVRVSLGNIRTLLNRLVEVYQEPFGDYSAIPTYQIFAGIKAYAKVALTGDGGDEVFVGYKDVKVFLFRQAFQMCRGLGNWFSDEMIGRLLRSRFRKKREVSYALAALRQEGSFAYEQLFRDGWSSYWRKFAMRPGLSAMTEKNGAEKNVADHFNSAGKNDLERYLNMSLEHMTQDYLVKIDRASMAHSIEARSPMLDQNLFNRVRKLPMKVLLKNNEPKSILKDLLDTKMGHRFSRRPKMGFTPPLGEWLRQEQVGRWVDQVLTDKESFVYSLFREEPLRQIIGEHQKGFDHTRRLWHLLFLNSWHSRFYGSGFPKIEMECYGKS